MTPDHHAIALDRTLTTSDAVTLNLLDMIGVGPFLTLPLLLGAMGGPQAMLGWVFGALLAACDGLVWAELGAAMPEAGGTYHYLGQMFPGRLGRWLSFLFVFQLCISAPLSVASGCIGLSQYAGFLWPGLLPQPTSQPWMRTLHAGGYTFGVTGGASTWLAIGAVLVAVALLYRKLSAMRRVAVPLLAMVLGTIVWAIVAGVQHGHITNAFRMPAGTFQMKHAFFAGLGSAMLIATYDYWGYYNVTFLGGETRTPGRTIPRAVLLSIAIVMVLYLALNVSVLSVLGAPAIIASADIASRRALLSTFMQTAYSPSLGSHLAHLLGSLAAVLVMVTAFASVLSLLLGYSRIPFAAARDGNFPAVFGRLHPKLGFPYVSLLGLAGMACLFCFFSLADVIAALVVLRICLQFVLQHVGVIVLRIRRPDMPRPFRLWFYPLPPLLALLGFSYIVLSRVNFTREVILACIVIGVGSLVFLVRIALARSCAGSKYVSS